MAIIRLEVYKQVGSEPGKALPAFGWPGGGSLYYLDDEGNTLCALCATDAGSYSADTIAGLEHEEGFPLLCDNDNSHVIESSHGPTDEDIASVKADLDYAAWKDGE